MSLIRQALVHYPYAIANALGLLLFLGVFAGMVRWALRLKTRAYLDYMQSLPLEEDDLERSHL